MGTKSAWAAACLPLALVGAVGALFAFVRAFDELHRLLPVVLLLAVMGLSWYGGRSVGMLAALLGIAALYVVPIAADSHPAVAPRGWVGISHSATAVESLALLLTALLTGGLRDA